MTSQAQPREQVRPVIWQPATPARRRQWVWMLFLLPALLVYSAFMAVPLFNSLRLSLYTGSGLTPAEFIGLGNYIDLLTNALWRTRLLNAILHTFGFFAIHMLVQNSLGLFLATLLSANFRGRNFFRTIVFAPTTLSVLVIGFLWTLILNPQWGAVNKILEGAGLEAYALPWLGDERLALLVISLVSCWQWVGMPTVLFMAALLGIPEELIEAARVDGASGWTTFWQIRLPLITPMIGLVSVLTFIGNFSAFDIVFAMAGAQGEPRYSTDLLGTFFYRTGIAGEHPIGIPNAGMGAAVAGIIFLILLAGVGLWLFTSRGQSVEG